jgi:hypothetical protein
MSFSVYLGMLGTGLIKAKSCEEKEEDLTVWW